MPCVRAEAASKLRQIERGSAAVMHGDPDGPAGGVSALRHGRALETPFTGRAVEALPARQEERARAGNRVQQARPPRQGARRGD